jgi:hypothetical protein
VICVNDEFAVARVGCRCQAELWAKLQRAMDVSFAGQQLTGATGLQELERVMCAHHLLTAQLQDPRQPVGERKIGWFSAPPPPQDGWAPSFPLDIDVDITKIPANSTLQVLS